MIRPLGCALALTLGCAHLGEPRDETLGALERGFTALDHGEHESARAHLARALAAMDDLALDGSDLEKAFASDPRKPYRGRPHERTLAALTVAALDVEAGRCDMARAAVKDARYFHARARRESAEEVALADEIDGVCDGTRAPFVLVLRGRGPTFSATGEHAESIRIANGGGDDVVGRIRVGQRARGRGPAIVAWASTYEATHVGHRRFDDVLAERAAWKSATEANGRAHLEEAQHELVEGAVGGDRRALTHGVAFAGAAVGWFAVSATQDARVDVRYVRSLPERAEIVR